MLKGLTPVGNLNYQFLYRMYRQKLKPKGVYETLRKYNVGYKWGQARRDWGIIRRAYERAERIRHTPKKAIPSEASYIPSPSVTHHNYHTVMKVRAYDKDFEEERDIYVTVTHEIKLPRKELESAAKEWMIDPSERFEYIRSTPDVGYSRIA